MWSVVKKRNSSIRTENWLAAQMSRYRLVELRATFAEIEAILGFALPKPAVPDYPTTSVECSRTFATGC